MQRLADVLVPCGRALRVAAWVITMQASLATLLIAQGSEPVILRWRLSPTEVVVVRAASSLRATEPDGRIAIDTLEASLVMRSGCAETMECRLIDLSRRSDAYALAMGSAPAAESRKLMIGKGSALVTIDSLWRSARVSRDSVGFSDTGEMLDDLEDAVPIVLPARAVRTGESWDIDRTASRTLHGVRYATTYSGTATLDSVAMRNGRPTGWLTVSGRRLRTQGMEERLFSDEQFHGVIAWDVAAGHPVTTAIVWDGRVASRAGMLRITTRSSTTVTARKGSELIF